MSSSEEHEHQPGFLKRALDHAAVATGLAVEVPVEHQEEPHSGHPPTTPVRSQPTVPSAVLPSRSIDSSAADVTAQFQANFPSVLQATPSAFQNFLAQKTELVESLKDSVSADKLEEAATKVALRIAKLTSKDVKDAMQAARAALQKLRAEIAASLAQERQDRIDGPTRHIEQSRSEIDKIGCEIADLQRHKMELEAGIAPQEQVIAEAESNLQYTSSVYSSSCGRIEETIAAMEQQLTTNKEGVKQ